MEFKLYQANDQLIRVTINEDGAPINLKDVEVMFTVSAGSRCVFSKNIGNGIEVVDEANGVIEITITNNDTDLMPGHYKYELTITDVDGRRYTTAQDRFYIKKSYGKECVE